MKEPLIANRKYKIRYKKKTKKRQRFQALESSALSLKSI